MSRTRRTRDPSSRLPSYRLHKASGQAVVTLSGRDFYLGPHGTKASRAEYDRLVGEWQANGRRLPEADNDLTVNELALAFWKHAQTYYVKNGRQTREQQAFKYALRPLRKLYGHTAAGTFSPKALKAVRQKMIDMGWCRTRINKQVRRIRQVFRWGVENELVPPSVDHGLRAVSGLKRNRTEARESEPVKPVPDEYVKAVLPFVSPQIKAMIELQELTGTRPCEVVIMRACDIDMGGDVWEYRPCEHKLEHFGHERVVMLGPRAQAIVEPFLKANTEAYLFDPREAEARRRAEQHGRRKTPLSCGNRPGTNQKRRPKRRPKDRYTTESYRQAIHRGCDRAWPVPDEFKNDPDKATAWKSEHRWSPGRLRHSRATKLRRRFGIEPTRAALGHASAVTSELYAERDSEVAKRIAREVG